MATARYAQRIIWQGIQATPSLSVGVSGGRICVAAPLRLRSQSSVSRLHTSCTLSSGSNKWSKIRHKKGEKDAARGNFYGALSREILACIRQHPTRSADPALNARLGVLLRKAKEMDVPNSKVAATLAKATSNDASDDKVLTFEAVGPSPKGGAPPVALYIECSSSSSGRTNARVREALAKSNGRLSSVAHLFTRTGLIRLEPAEGKQFDDVFDLAVEAGAEDVRTYEEEDGTGGIEVVCAPTELIAVSNALTSAGHTVHSAVSAMLPSGPTLRFRSSDPEEAQAEEEDVEEGEVLGYVNEDDVEKLDKLQDFLEEHADLTRIWSNLEGWPEER